jgi:hypothetical protein
MTLSTPTARAALVARRPVKKWRETLAILATYTTHEQWAAECDALARRLAAASNARAATLCWICCGAVDEVVAQWNQALAGDASVDALQVSSSYACQWNQALAGDASVDALQASSNYACQRGRLLVGALDVGCHCGPSV